MEQQQIISPVNITTLTDSYKIAHWLMYPENTEYVYSYFSSRNGATFNNTVFFGLQILALNYLSGRVVTREKIDKGQKLIDAHMGPGLFNCAGWEYILKEYEGKLPLTIKAVAEGTPVSTDNVLMSITNNDSKIGWLTNYVETLLSKLWYGSTVASLSREVKIMGKHYLEKTSDNDVNAILNFMLHDFGFRGTTCPEQAGIGGAAHLINFNGTDTLRGLEYAMDYYKSDVCGFSVAATEHSVMTARGPKGEPIVVNDLLKAFPTGILAMVIDSFDYDYFIDNIVREKRSQILTRDGKTVFRPDSGEPVSTTLRVLELLDSVFGSQKNTKGYRVLHPKIGMLWGDGIDYNGIRNILHAMSSAGWAAENIVFGMGGGLLQKVNRDTQRFAIKSSAQCRNGEWYDVFKQPKDISKASKKGIQYLYKNGAGEFYTTNVEESGQKDYLETVFIDGELIILHDFKDIKERAVI